jgi:hypothetical protein
MSTRPAWFNGSIIGAVFALIMVSASVHVSFGTVLLNLLALGCFVAPIVAAVRDGDLRS